MITEHHHAHPDDYGDLNTDCRDHSEPPENYSYLHDSNWQRKMSKTHEQFRCRECGLWKIWVKK